MVNRRVLKKVTEKGNTEQINEINVAKYLEGLKINKDPGEDFIRDWISKHGPSFRKKFSLRDCKETLAQMKIIRKGIREKLLFITKATKQLEELEDEVLIDVENLEKEENGKGK